MDKFFPDEDNFFAESSQADSQTGVWSHPLEEETFSQKINENMFSDPTWTSPHQVLEDSAVTEFMQEK
jgi:hypothetical protein